MDSKLFVDDLLSVYLKYGQSKGFDCELIHSENGHAIAKFTGKDVWKAFEAETGKHCLQRVPPTETRGRVQTSFVTVAVLPIPQETVLKSLPEKDLKITFQRGHGPGGQHQNSTFSAARVVHIPTGIMVFINGRDQHANRRDAIRIVTVRVNELYQQQKQSDKREVRKVLALGGRGQTEKIRTYNFTNSLAVDHRNGKKTKNMKALMKGDLGLLLS
jgi:peptide chain release factor 1